MIPEVNYLAVLVAAIVNMVVGSLWFGPLFGKKWMALSGIDMARLGEMKQRSMTLTYILAFIGSLVMSLVLWHSAVFAVGFLQESSVWCGALIGALSWLGFVGPITLGMVLWEGKPWRLWVLLNSYHLISLIIMGAILVAWM